MTTPFTALSAFSRCSRPLDSFSVISFTVFLCFLSLALWPQAMSDAAEVATSPSLPVVVCNVGTGVDRDNPALSNKLWSNDAEIRGEDFVDDDDNGYVDDYYGYNFVDGDGNVGDNVGHGTHIAGTIAGLNTGLTAFKNWSPTIITCQFINYQGGTKRNATKCLKYCRANMVTFVVFPFEAHLYGTKFMVEVNRLNSSGVLFISAAGDTASNIDATSDVVKMPPNAIVVSSVDKDNKLSSFSNYGNKTVTLAAPGEDQVSTVANGYFATSGTAMAAANVGRYAALSYGIKYRNLTDILEIFRSTLTLSDDLRDKTLWGGVADEDEVVAYSKPASSPVAARSSQSEEQSYRVPFSDWYWTWKPE